MSATTVTATTTATAAVTTEQAFQLLHAPLQLLNGNRTNKNELLYDFSSLSAALLYSISGLFGLLSGGFFLSGSFSLIGE